MNMNTPNIPPDSNTQEHAITKPAPENAHNGLPTVLKKIAQMEKVRSRS
jgi:hypothetical protein